MSKIGGMGTPRGMQGLNMKYSLQNPLGYLLYTLSETMMTNTPSGQHCAKKETKRCWSIPIYSKPYAQGWVIETLNDTWL